MKTLMTLAFWFATLIGWRAPTVACRLARWAAPAVGNQADRLIGRLTPGDASARMATGEDVSYHRYIGGA